MTHLYPSPLPRPSPLSQPQCPVPGHLVQGPVPYAGGPWPRQGGAAELAHARHPGHRLHRRGQDPGAGRPGRQRHGHPTR